MSTQPATVAPGSVRVRLAALAIEAARAVDGITGADAGPEGLLVTTSGSTSVIGVRVVAEPEGRYSVDLGLHARLVPLNPLAETVRGCVTRAITHAGLGAALGAVSVSFLAVTTDTEARA